MTDLKRRTKRYRRPFFSSLLVVVALCIAGCGDTTSDTATPAEQLQARVLKRSGKTLEQHRDFAPFALFDRNGDGRLSSAEATHAKRAGLDVGSLDSIHQADEAKKEPNR